MTVLVAGGTGALGSAVVRELAGSGYEVTVLDRQGEADGATTVRADLLDPAATTEAVAGVDRLEAVVNLVGGFAMGPKVGDSSLEDFEKMLRLNLLILTLFGNSDCRLNCFLSANCKSVKSHFYKNYKDKEDKISTKSYQFFILKIEL